MWPPGEVSGMQLVTLGGAALRLTPPGRERLETAQQLDVSVTGPEANAAVAAGRLGADASWLSRLTDGPLGRRLAAELRAHDVEVVAESAEDRQGVVFFERGASPRGDARIIDRGGEAAGGLELENLPTEPIAEADTAYVTATTLQGARSLAESTASFLQTAHENGATTAMGLLDVGAWNDIETARDRLERVLPAVDVLIASGAAVEAVFDRSGEPTQVTHALASSHDLEVVALRRPHDAAVWQDSTVSELAALEVDAVDTTGGADAFAGAFLAALSDGTATSALRSALAADALVQTTAGSLAAFSAEEVADVAEDVSPT
jgi:2-dehydro-3-deoxygluconokinase